MSKKVIKSALVIGGSGALGKSVVNSLKTLKSGCFVYSADFIKNKQASKNILLPKKYDKDSMKQIRKNLKHKFDLIINVAGGFKPHNLKNDDIVSIAEKMYSANMLSSILAANIAKSHMKNNGLLVLTGAAGVKDSTGTGILAYQLAKHSVHNLTNILVENPQELPNVKKIVTLLPYIFYLFSINFLLIFIAYCLC